MSFFRIQHLLAASSVALSSDHKSIKHSISSTNKKVTYSPSLLHTATPFFFNKAPFRNFTNRSIQNPVPMPSNSGKRSPFQVYQAHLKSESRKDLQIKLLPYQDPTEKPAPSRKSGLFDAAALTLGGMLAIYKAQGVQTSESEKVTSSSNVTTPSIEKNKEPTQQEKDYALELLWRFVRHQLGFTEANVGTRAEEPKTADGIRLWLEDPKNKDLIPSVKKIIVHDPIVHLSLLSHEIGKFTGLETLIISHQSLKSIPDSIGQLTNLKKLSLSSNYIEEIPDSIGELTLLEALNLSGNHIKKFPDSLGRLARLRELQLENTKMTTFPPFIENLRSLELLDLSNNKIVDIPSFIGKLEALEQLHFENNKITALPDSIGLLISLKYFQIRENQIRKLPHSIGNLTNLSTFCCSDNLLTSIPDPITKLFREDRKKFFYIFGNPLLFTYDQKLNEPPFNYDKWKASSYVANLAHSCQSHLGSLARSIMIDANDQAIKLEFEHLSDEMKERIIKKRKELSSSSDAPMHSMDDFFSDRPLLVRAFMGAIKEKWEGIDVEKKGQINQMIGLSPEGLPMDKEWNVIAFIDALALMNGEKRRGFFARFSRE